MAALVGMVGRAEGEEWGKKTWVYKKVGELEIKADVYRAGDEKTRPVVVWIHGGALINGHREAVSGKVMDWAKKSGYVLVSIDYRLAPESQLPLVVEDVQDAMKWIRKEGPKLFHADPAKLAVTGGSAGGYLTLTTGYRVQPAPSVLISFWGYGDLVGDWYSRPSPHARHQTSKMPRDEALRQVSGPPIADSRDRPGNGGAFYQYCRQQGAWPQAVSGWNPHTEPEKFHPFMPVKNVTPQYPPTVLVHGDKDTDVPYEQSTLMAEQFRAQQVPFELLTIANGEHGLSGGDPKVIEAAYEKAFQFADKYLKE